MTAIVYRNENPTAASETVYKNAGLTPDEFDGNFKSIEDEKIDILDIDQLFQELMEEIKQRRIFE